MNIEEIKELATKLTEDEAMDLYHVMSRTHGWAGTVFTADDIRVRYEELHEDEDGYTPLTDEQVKAVQQTRAWSKYIGEFMCSEAWDIIDTATDDMFEAIK